MKILYLLKKEPDETAKTFMKEHMKSHEVAVVDIRENGRYDEIVDLVFSSDKVISW